MYIAIDDTYGPKSPTTSRYVTGARRTHVAVIFPDEQVGEIREQLLDCLKVINEEYGIGAKEFHFVDIYNRNGAWADVADQLNLKIFGFFAEIYGRYRWEVRVQTVDDRTLGDFGIAGITGKIEGLDLSNRSDLSLMMLVLGRLKPMIRSRKEPVTILVDEGSGRAGAKFGKVLFADLDGRVTASYARSSEEPLLQIADFFAFSINRCTHLGLKQNRTDMDNWFLQLIGSMDIQSPELMKATLDLGFSVTDMDALHDLDRELKKRSSPDDD